ncbi:Heat shock protein SSA2 [Zancudomyces culisetae]|uniref:Heat shock protein SSA2 n=1 Tax=Zancudomyces culisetae TaxID=1213189 RepID=A0A1R1PID5_ZANCU|nr:Heat shock protein SSA2 [Zancudomyces culisetae]|eukprot:OMH80612.1 Heat shock protein SSA2 [Zancudomyces culisetae]
MQERVNVYVGISLGTYNTVIAISDREGDSHVIANNDGEHKTPLYIGITKDHEEEEGHEEEVVFGSQAKIQSAYNSGNTVVKFKDYLGITEKEAQDAAIEKESKSVFCKLQRLATTGELGYTINGKEYTVYQIMKEYIDNLYKVVTKYIGETKKIAGVAISVPSYFNSKQREQMQQLCKELDIPNAQLVDEQTAGIVSSTRGQKLLAADKEYTKNVLVVNVGGTKTAVSIYTVGELVSEIGTVVTDKVSGEEFDKVLTNYLHKQPPTSTRATIKLQHSVENAKHTLSLSTTAHCFVEALDNGVDFSANITRVRFDLLSAKLYTQLIDTIDTLLQSYSYNRSEIDSIVLLGGSCKIPKLANRVKALFPYASVSTATSSQNADSGSGSGKGKSHSIECDEAIAIGSSKLAAYNDHNPAISARSSPSYPIGLKLADSLFHPLVPRNSPLPFVKKFSFAIPKNGANHHFAVCKGSLYQPPHSESDDEDDSAEDNSSAPRYVPDSSAPLIAEFSVPSSSDSDTDNVDLTVFISSSGKLEFKVACNDQDISL